MRAFVLGLIVFGLAAAAILADNLVGLGIGIEHIASPLQSI